MAEDDNGMGRALSTSSATRFSNSSAVSRSPSESDRVNTDPSRASTISSYVSSSSSGKSSSYVMSGPSFRSDERASPEPLGESFGDRRRDQRAHITAEWRDFTDPFRCQA